MENIDDIKKQYELTPEEKERIGQIILAKYTHEKGTTNRPFAVIVIGQPGAGKSGLMAYTEGQFESAIALDIDDLRCYHPKYDEVSANHPHAFEAVTGAFATSMIHYLTPRLIDKKHNLILHKTRGDEAVIDDTIIPLQNEGYDVILRVLAVNHLESKMSALLRSLAERDKFDCCRWVRKDYHNKQYETIPQLADTIKKRKLADHIEVFTRGEKLKQPYLQYSTVVNEKILSNPSMKTENGEMMIGQFNPHGYSSLTSAIDKARDIDLPKILGKIDERVDGVKQRVSSNDEAWPYISEIEEIAANYRSKEKIG